MGKNVCENVCDDHDDNRDGIKYVFYVFIQQNISCTILINKHIIFQFKLLLMNVQKTFIYKLKH